MRAQVSFVLTLTQSTRVTDTRTDGQRGLGNTVRCITCSRTVKIAVDYGCNAHPGSGHENIVEDEQQLNYRILTIFNQLVKTADSGVLNCSAWNAAIFETDVICKEWR